MKISESCNALSAKKKLWDKGQEIIANNRIKCSQCSTVYNFEPPRWRVLADVPAPEE